MTASHPARDADACIVTQPNPFSRRVQEDEHVYCGPEAVQEPKPQWYMLPQETGEGKSQRDKCMARILKGDGSWKGLGSDDPQWRPRGDDCQYEQAATWTEERVCSVLKQHGINMIHFAGDSIMRCLYW